MTDTGRIMLAAAAIIAGLGLETATAQGRGAGMDIGERFTALDADGSGALTRQEIAAGATARFQQMDTDGDGALSEAEVAAMISERAAKAGRDVSERRVGKMAGRVIGRMDADDDGRVTLADMQANTDKRLDRMFDRMDSDNSGDITLAEAQSVERKRKNR